MKNQLFIGILSLACSLNAPSAFAAEIACRLLSVANAGELPAEIYLEVPSSNASKRIVPGGSLSAEPLNLSVPAGTLLRVKDGKGADARVLGETEVKDGVSEILFFLVPASVGANADGAKDTPAGPEPGTGEAPAEPAEKPEAKPFWKCIASDGSPKELSRGGLALVNGTDGEVRITFAEIAATVSASGTLFLEEPSSKDDFNMVPIKVECGTNDHWRMVNEGATRFTGHTVYWVVVYELPMLKRARVQFFEKMM
jgi:hypothetical protein